MKWDPEWLKIADRTVDTRIEGWKVSAAKIGEQLRQSRVKVETELGKLARL